MQYVPLNKLYYSDSKNFERIYAERYNSEYTNRIDFRIGEYGAFFVETPEIFKKLLNIQKADKAVLYLCAELPGVALEQFSMRCLVDEIVLTNNIEGVHSTRREISSVLDELQSKDKRTRFEGLAQKYVMLKKGDELSIQSCEDIRKIYDELVLDEVVKNEPHNRPDGLIFRKGSVSVSSATQKELHRGLYPESRITEAMDKALAYLNDGSVELLYRAAAFHYFVGYIHPFYDGNGRLNRFISSYLLGRELSPQLSYRLSYTIKESLTDYYNAFNICNDPKSRGDITPFITMFLSVVETSTLQLKNALEKREQQLYYYLGYRGLLPDADGAKMWELYDYLMEAELFSENGIAKEELTELLKISSGTLLKKLAVIERAGLLNSCIKNRKKYYRINRDALDAIIEKA